MADKGKIVLAYSGGLDTTVILHWLRTISCHASMPTAFTKAATFWARRSLDR